MSADSPGRAFLRRLSACSLLLSLGAEAGPGAAGGPKNFSRACWVLEASGVRAGGPAVPAGSEPGLGLILGGTAASRGAGGVTGRGSGVPGDWAGREAAAAAVPQPVGELLVTRMLALVVATGLHTWTRDEVVVGGPEEDPTAPSPFASWAFLGVLRDPEPKGAAPCCLGATPRSGEPEELAPGWWPAEGGTPGSLVLGRGGLDLRQLRWYSFPSASCRCTRCTCVPQMAQMLLSRPPTDAGPWGRQEPLKPPQPRLPCGQRPAS